MMQYFNRVMESPRLLIWLGIFVFAYSWIASFLLQLWIIPALFSNPEAAEGLVVIDSTGFNEFAKAKANEISSLGWSAWELRPNGHLPVGIASVFYVVFGPAPTSMLPFNAVVHALSTCLVAVIFRNFFSVIPALMGALAFALNPAAFEWVAQIHRDGVFILGNLMLFMGALRFIPETDTLERKSPKHWASLLVVTIAGTLLIWVARAYWVQVVLATISLLAAFLIIVLVLKRTAIDKRRVAGSAAMFLGLGLFQLWLILFHVPFEQTNIDTPPSISTFAKNENDGQSHQGSISTTWKRSDWLPEAIERRFYRMAAARWGAIMQGGGGTLVDANLPLDSAMAIVGYLPRALQLGILSPLPEFWGGQGSTPAMTMGRKVMGVVTLIFYVCLFGLVIGIYPMRNRIRFWALIGMCCIGILVYAVTYPNIGALMRFRYGFYMLLVGLGLACWVDLWMKCKRKSPSI